MPKVYLRPIDKFRETLRHNLNMAKGGKNYAELGRIIGRAKSTIKARMDDPLTMTLDELFMLCQHEHIDPAEFVGGELRLRGQGTVFIERTD